MTEFNGFEMPLEYEGIEAEHAHVRSRVGIFDVSHMGQILIEGEEATQKLNYLFTNRLPMQGQVRYGMMLNERGTVMDDMLVYGLYSEGYLLVPNAGNIEKIYNHCVKHIGSKYVKNRSSEYGLIALQGPMADEIMHEYLEFPVLKRFQFAIGNYDNDGIIISRTGYTGEDGYELYVPSYALVDVWNDFLETTGVKPIGLGARDTLRFEAGLPLYGHEISENYKPTEAGLDFALNFKKDFLGKEALEQDPGAFKLIGLELLDPGIARENTLMFDTTPPDLRGNEHEHPTIKMNTMHTKKDELPIGKVTTGYKLKSQGRSLAMAFVYPTLLNDWSRLVIRNNEKKFKVVDLPFIKR